MGEFIEKTSIRKRTGKHSFRGNVNLSMYFIRFVIMKKSLHFFVLICLAAGIVSCSGNGKTTDIKHIARASDFGRIDSSIPEYLKALRASSGTNELHSVMVLKDGKKLAEYYDTGYGPDFLNICWSASKTFTATALGFAVQDGLVSLSDKLVDIIPESMLPDTVSDTLRELDVYNLLRMSSGLHDDIGGIGSHATLHPTKENLAKGFYFKPGEQYKYCSFNTYLLSVIVQTVTGMPVSEYLDGKLFKPLGIRNYHWDKCAEGYDTGGWGLYLTTESLAKMGQFFLQDGMWEGRQLLDKEWMKAAHTPQIMQSPGDEVLTDHTSGYGYQMWVCTHNAYRLDGARGQWVFVCPDKNAVIVITQVCMKTRDVIGQVWPTIYDAI